MTIHKLTAGSGYTYLTRHVAGGDVDRVRGMDAADYYTAEGNPPGRWLGRGAHLLGLEGQAVSEAQMKALFGQGRHPDAERIVSEYLATHTRPGMTEDQFAGVEVEARRAAALGRAYPRYAALPPFEDRVRSRLDGIAERTGRDPSPAEVAKVRVEEARRPRQAVAGYDVVFSPVKSAAILWALDPRERVRRAVWQAHRTAMTSALGLLEEHAAFTRTGAAGVAQIDTHGLVAAAFDHHDSRDGDPNLHTHVAIANKVLGVDGVWRALDGRSLYRITVAASEHYNTVFQAALTEALGVGWTARGAGRGKEPVWEIDGVPEHLIRMFSRRRVALAGRYEELVAGYRAEHGHDPPAAVAHKLARQANLDTREGKKPPRALAAMREQWTAEAIAAVGPGVVRAVMAAVPDGPGPSGTVPQPVLPVPVGPAPTQPLVPAPAAVDQSAPAAHPTLGQRIEALADQVVAAVSEKRSTWTVWNLRAEAERLLRAEPVAGGVAGHLAAVEAVTARSVSLRHSLCIEAPTLMVEPSRLRRRDGQSVFVEHAAARYTSRTVLDAEERLLAAARTVAGHALPAGQAAAAVDAALTVFEVREGTVLDEGQRHLVQGFVADPRLLVVGIGAAGTGKTTAMRAYLHTLRTLPAITGHPTGRLVPLATSAASAAVLGQELGVEAENVHKFLHEHLHGPHTNALTDGGPVPDSHAVFRLGPGDVVLVDEAGMAGTLNLDRLVTIAARRGAVVRLLGDYRQLAAVESGGALRLIATDVGAVDLSTVHRFSDPDEAAATLQLRIGDTHGLAFYEQAGRVVGGSTSAMLEAAYTGWLADVQAGRTSFMPAATNTHAADLSARARADRVTAGQVEPNGVELHDGNLAGVGDWIVTRLNARRLSMNGGRDFVRNGDPWRVLTRHADGTLRVEHLGHGGRVTLPPEYVAASVELLYATTAHRVQGGTVDTAHPLVTDAMTREHLYVVATRARHATTLYVATHEILPLEDDERRDVARRDPDARAALEVLHDILGREGAEPSATQTIRDQHAAAESLATLVPRYLHALDRLRPRGDAAEEESAAVGPLPWTPAAGDHPNERVRDYLHAAAAGIRARVDELADQVIAERPAWSDVLGPAPADASVHSRWRQQVGVVAAYREQYAVTGDDPAHPLGPFVEPGQPGHRVYWHAAAAIVAARRLATPPADPELSVAVQPPSSHSPRTVIHRHAVHTYGCLPPAERDAIVTAMVATTGNLWHGDTVDSADPDTAATHPAHDRQLRDALARRGYLRDHLPEHRPKPLPPRPAPPRLQPPGRGPHLGM